MVDAVDQLDETELRALIDYTRRHKRFLHPTVTEQSEPGPAKKSSESRSEGYTEVVKREPCGEDCPDDGSDCLDDETHLY